MQLPRFVTPVLTLAIVAGLALGGYLTRATWLPLIQQGKSAEPDEPATATGEAGTSSEKIIVSDQAQTNLGLTAKRLKAQSFWRSIQVPGMVVDRPGQSDQGVVAPAAGVVIRVARVPGDTVRPGELLFRLRLLSESVHQTQSELFKAAQDIKLAQATRKRYVSLAGAVPEVRIIEVDNQITRLEVAVKALRQELLNRGLADEQIDGVAEGRFASEVPIVVPRPSPDARPLTAAVAPPAFEVQELKVELGQHVQAGQTLCLLANHQALDIEGRAFRDETPLLERSVKDTEKTPVEVDFLEDPGAGWPAFAQTLRIRHLANTIDPINRTFAFRMPLENQSRTIEEDGRTQMLWRFRPGQRVRVLVRVEKYDNVFVLPANAVAHEGPEAFVFTQNVNTYERKGVRVLLQDRNHVIVANDGSLPTYLKDKEVWTISAVAQTAAAQLSRMAKAGSSGVPKGYHIHADGSLHKNENESK